MIDEHQETIERAYVHAVMLAPHLGMSAAQVRASLLDAEEVYAKPRRVILAAAHRVIDSGNPTDFATLALEVENDGEALTELIECSQVPQTVSLSSMFAVLRDRAYRVERTRIMATAADSEARGEQVDEDELTAKLRELKRDESMDTLDAEGLMRISLLRISRMETGRDLVVRTGHAIIDEAIGGLDAGGLTVVGARPSVGKSTLALDIAFRSPARVAVVSVEDPAQTWATRYTAKESGVDARSIRSGTGLYPGDFEAMHGSFGAAKARRFAIIDASGKTSLPEVRAAMRVHHRRHAAQIYIVDYAQAVTLSAKQATDARERINRIIEGLKSEAAQLGAHMVLLSQLRRVDDETREPSRQDLKESGKFEEAAENILLLWRNKRGTVCGRVSKAKGGMPGLGFVLPQSPVTMAFGEAREMTYADEDRDDDDNKRKGGR